MQSVVCIVGIVLVILLYLIGYYIMYKAKDNTKVLLAGACTILSAIVVGIVSFIVGRNLENEEKESSQSSQIEETCNLTHFEDIPDNIEGCAIVDTTNRRFYVTRMSDKEDSSSEECDNVNSISDSTWPEDSSGL